MFLLLPAITLALLCIFVFPMDANCETNDHHWPEPGGSIFFILQMFQCIYALYEMALNKDERVANLKKNFLLSTRFSQSCKQLNWTSTPPGIGINSIIVTKVDNWPTRPRPIGGHYIYTLCLYVHPSVCPYVRPSVRKTNQGYNAKTKYTTTLNVAWWVTLKSPDLFDIRIKPEHVVPAG